MTTHNLIDFDADTKSFHLHNANISYIFSIDEHGVVGHDYYGQRLNQYHGQLRNPQRDRGFSGNFPGTTDRTYSLDFFLQEYGSNGNGDYRNVASVIRQADGSRAANFVYQDYEIVAGKPGLEGLPAAYVEKENEAETLRVRLVDSVSQLTLTLNYTIYRDFDIIARSVVLTNASQKTVNIEKLASMQLDLPAQGGKQVLSFPGGHVNERNLQRENIGHGTKVFESRRGTTSHQMNNFIVIVDQQTTEFSGEAIGVSLVYSGSHKEEVSKDQFGSYRILSGINDDQFDWQLDPAEHFQTPEVLLTYSANGLNEMSDHLNGLLRTRVARGQFRDKVRPIVINNWEATFWNFDEAKLTPIIDEAKALGIEMFVLDDGWFGHRDSDNSSLGDWKIYEEKFPNGFQHFTDYVHNQGMQFGMWFEPEMISIDSDLYRAHPEYMLKVPNRQPSPSRDQFVLDVGRQEVRDNVYEQMAKILDGGKVDYVKWDMNRNLTDIYAVDLPAERQGEVMHRYVLGLYALLEKLTTNYPDVLWEGCSGGGGRIDTGFLYYMPQSWISDNTDAVDRMRIQYNSSMAYPVSSMTSHVSVSPNQQTGRMTPMETRGAVAMSGVLGYELDLTELTESEKLVVKEQVNKYKEARELIQFGHFVRLINPEMGLGNRYAWMFVDDTADEALVFSFKILSDAQPEFSTLKLAGLDANKTYQNIETKAEFGGDELMRAGLYETFEQADFTTNVYHFKAL